MDFQDHLDRNARPRTEALLNQRLLARASLYRLPEELRPRFQEPFGPVYSTRELLDHLTPKDKVVAVGDVVSKTLLQAGRDPWIMVVDYKTQRAADDPELKRVLGAWGSKVLKVENPPATVSDELFHAVAQALKSAKTVRIEVTGEEDLAGLPFLALAKDATIVLYGVPNRGVCFVRVTGAVRRTAQDLLARMRVE